MSMVGQPKQGTRSSLIIYPLCSQYVPITQERLNPSTQSYMLEDRYYHGMVAWMRPGYSDLPPASSVPQTGQSGASSNPQTWLAGISLVNGDFNRNYFALSDPHRDQLFCHSFWHLIWKYIWHIYIYMCVCVFWHLIMAFYLTFYSGILSGTYSAILTGIYSDIFFGILPRSSTLSDILSGINSDILSGIYSGFLPSSMWHSFLTVYLAAGIYSDLLFCHSIWHSFWQSFWHSFGILSGFLFWHSIWHLFWHSLWHGHCRTSTASARFQQCPLRSGARSWGPAAPTEIWSSLLGGGGRRKEVILIQLAGWEIYRKILINW